MIGLLVFAQTVQTLAPGIPNAVPPTGFSCDLSAADGSRFTVAGTTPAFPKGWDPNQSKFEPVASSHVEAFRGRAVAIRPREAGEWFREFQISGGAPNDVTYNLNLMLRREGTSIAYTTRYQSTGKPIPYDYHAAGLCKADFAPAAAGQERGRR